MNTLVVPASKARQRRRPPPRSYPGDRRPHWPQRPRAYASGRTDTTIAPVSLSKRTPSTTVRTSPHPRSHTLLFRTLICSSAFRTVRQPKNLEADRVQPIQSPPNHPRIQQKSAICAGESVLCIGFRTSGAWGRRRRVASSFCATPATVWPLNNECPDHGFSYISVLACKKS